MRYRQLGRTGLFVSEICLGTMTFAGTRDMWAAIGSVEQKGATEMVEHLRCRFGDGIIEEERNIIRQVELREVGHRFEKNESALNGISLVARRGEMICVMGPSGCGKSTLLRTLAGQLKPKSGEINMNGFSLYGSLPNLTPYIAYIPQEDAFDPLLKVQENLDYSVAVRCPHLPAEERRRHDCRYDRRHVEHRSGRRVWQRHDRCRRSVRR